MIDRHAFDKNNFYRDNISFSSNNRANREYISKLRAFKHARTACKQKINIHIYNVCMCLYAYIYNFNISFK